MSLHGNSSQSLDDAEFGPVVSAPAVESHLPIECDHGYTEGCPDCDVPAWLPETVGSGKRLR